MEEQTSVQTPDGRTQEVFTTTTEMPKDPLSTEETTESEESIEAQEMTVEDSEKSQDDTDDYSKRVQKRIAKLTSDRLAAEHKAKQLEEKLKSFEERAGARPERPSLDKFVDEYGEVDHGKYNEAITAYEDQLLGWRENQRDRTEAERQAEIEKIAKVEAFNAAADAVRAKYEDFDQVIEKPVFGENLRQAILDSQAAEVAYYLGRNESEALRLNQMTPAQMMRELGRLEGRISTLMKTPTKAAPPIAPVDDTTGIQQKDPSKMTDDEWFKWRQQQRMEKFKKG